MGNISFHVLKDFISDNVLIQGKTKVLLIMSQEDNVFGFSGFFETRYLIS